MVCLLLCLPGLLLGVYGAFATTTCPDCMHALYLVPATEGREAGLACGEAAPSWIMDAALGVTGFALLVAALGGASWIVRRMSGAARSVSVGRLVGWANLTAMGAASLLGGLVAISGEGEWRYRYAALVVPCLAISAALAWVLLRAGGAVRGP